jgi:predicted dehydrogenase
MNQQNPLNLCIVGCGGISHAHGHAARRIPDKVRFVACCDVVEERAAAWAKEYGCHASYTDYEKMIRAEKPDAVLLATWPNQHREQIEKCLAAGVKNILCEKALALTGAEAVEICGLVRRAGAFVMEGFMYRHNPAIRKLEQILSWGHLGPVDNVRACFSTFMAEAAPAGDADRNWRQRKECGGGVPYDFACYCVNACGHFSGGLPRRAHCIGNLSPYDTISRMHGTIEYDNGVVGIIESSHSASFTQELQITCARGILNLPLAWTVHKDVTITQRHSGWNSMACDQYVTEGVADGFTSYQFQLANFADAVGGRAKPVLPLVQSVVNTCALEALVTSVLEKRIVDVRIPREIEEAYATRKKEKPA